MMRSASTILLALDTSTRTVGLALYDGVQVLSEFTWNSQDHHTVELAPAVADMLEKTSLTASSLGALAVAIGPGSFTGLRIGLALAKGMAIAKRLPLIGIPTLDSLALAQPVLNIPMAAILRAGRGRLAVSWYRAVKGAWQPAVANLAQSGDTEAAQAQGKEYRTEVFTPEDLAQKIKTPTLVCGELTDEERRLFERKRKNVILASPAQSLRRPAFPAELGWRRWQAGKSDDPASLAPIYLHYNEPIPG